MRPVKALTCEQLVRFAVLAVFWRGMLPFREGGPHIVVATDAWGQLLMLHGIMHQ